MFNDIVFSILPVSHEKYLLAFAMSHINMDLKLSENLSIQVFQALIHQDLIKNEKGLIVFYINGPTEEIAFNHCIRLKAEQSNDLFDYKDIKNFCLDIIQQNKSTSNNFIYGCKCRDISISNIKNYKFIIDVYQKVQLEDFKSWLINFQTMLSKSPDKFYYSKIGTMK